MDIQLLLIAFVNDIELHMNYICGYLTTIGGNYGYLQFTLTLEHFELSRAFDNKKNMYIELNINLYSKVFTAKVFRNCWNFHTTKCLFIIKVF